MVNTIVIYYKTSVKAYLKYYAWDIRHEGRTWSGQEAQKRYDLLPEKIEMHGGKLFWSDDERLTVLALLLENVGIDKVVRLGNPEIWRKAIGKMLHTEGAT